MRTIAGQQDVARQLIDQSPLNFDQIVFQDLVADYASQVDAQVIAGTGTNGTILGILNMVSVAMKHGWRHHRSDGCAHHPGCVLRDGQRHSAGARRAPYAAAGDLHAPAPVGLRPEPARHTNRPLFPPLSQDPQNAAGILTNVASEQVVGNMQGLPIITDPNFPVNLGSEKPSGTEDPILITRVTDHVLWESGLRTMAYPETLSGQLTVRLQVFGYLAFTAARYTVSSAEITGLTTPTF
ncbi:MAG: hypothetical protein QOE20_1497 [Mycobacterium sp.]|nr:hypothetical protein [Mycobacterium sp.]